MRCFVRGNACIQPPTFKVTGGGEPMLFLVDPETPTMNVCTFDCKKFCKGVFYPLYGIEI